MNFFINFILKHGLLAMFFFILIEYACFPISSEIVLPFSGAVASINSISYFVILPLSVIAGILGTSICYFLGRIGGSLLLDRIMLRFPKTKAPILSSFEKFEKYGTMAVFLGRLIPLCRTYIAFVAGSVKQSYPVFIGASLLGISIWNSLLIGLGYILKENWSYIDIYYQDYKHIFLIAILIITISFLSSKVLKNRF
jgi:membrane protein DedA with SNARE-associated domain